MEIVKDIVIIIALAAVAALCIYLIVVLSKVRSILTVVERDIKEISLKAMPVIENLEVITDKVKNVTETIDEQVDTIRSSINAIKGIADSIVEFEQRIQDRIEEPVMETVGTFAAIFKGVRTFVARMRA